ncbi:LOW QUALITY PROTEIN: uncharacterized protein LOC108112102 [Drosophila eugracilis]|uniref:LOW QUALITY PROTEIN: uncharacterized protein LOC108112102 n=1 Tax=Drosophila eugracilis TaxID=29029 RepID=UPI0007E60981|nr:LOW QUALITY PROTEIN: uncharacterized protein LOC108112102 [Drosophila eugracilis]
MALRRSRGEGYVLRLRLIKLAKSSSSSGGSGNLRSSSGSRIIIKFDINNIRNSGCSPPPTRSPPLDSLLINKRRLPWQKFRDGLRCLKILRHLSSRAKVKVSHRRSRTWSVAEICQRSGAYGKPLISLSNLCPGAQLDRSFGISQEWEQRECCVI